MKWWEKALKIAPFGRDDRTLCPWLAYGLASASSQSIVPCACGTGRFWKKAAHHFVVGYFQMSLRDEVFPERYLALMLTRMGGCRTPGNCLDATMKRDLRFRPDCSGATSSTKPLTAHR
jgi:hypothetical protein